MRKLFTLIIVALVFYSCKEGWTENEKETYMSHCVAAMVRNGFETQQSQNYCKCMLEKTEKESPDVRDAEKISEQKRNDWAKECLR